VERAREENVRRHGQMGREGVRGRRRDKRIGYTGLHIGFKLNVKCPCMSHEIHFPHGDLE